MAFCWRFSVCVLSMISFVLLTCLQRTSSYCWTSTRSGFSAERLLPSSVLLSSRRYTSSNDGNRKRGPDSSSSPTTDRKQSSTGRRGPPPHRGAAAPRTKPSNVIAGQAKLPSRLEANVRINKCLAGLSRRAADAAVAEGRVTVNGMVASNGSKVQKGDTVRLDDQVQSWEHWALAKQVAPAKKVENRSFVYLKYWKPRGVTCTSDLRDTSNIISAGYVNEQLLSMF